MFLIRQTQFKTINTAILAAKNKPVSLGYVWNSIFYKPYDQYVLAFSKGVQAAPSGWCSVSPNCIIFQAKEQP